MSFQTVEWPNDGGFGGHLPAIGALVLGSFFLLFFRLLAPKWWFSSVVPFKSTPKTGTHQEMMNPYPGRYG